MAAKIYISIVHKGALFSTSSPAYLSSWFFDNITILTGMRWYCIIVLICISLIISDLFTSHSNVGHLYVFNGKVQFSSVVSDSLWPHEPQHARPPCPSPTPGVHPNPCLLCWWCHPTISSSVIPFSSCPQSFPVSGSFQMSQLFAWGGQSIGVSTSTSVLPVNTQNWSPLGWTGWISLQSKKFLSLL